MIQNYPQGYIQQSIPTVQSSVSSEPKKVETPEPPIRKNTSEYDKIMQEYNKLNSQAIGAERRGDVVPKAVYERLSQLKESADNLARTGRAFYYEKQEVKPEQQYTVNIEGKGYSVAPALQSQFIESKTGYIYEPKALEQGQMILLGKNINGVTIPVSSIAQDTSPYRQEVKLNNLEAQNGGNPIFGRTSGTFNGIGNNGLVDNTINSQNTFQKANPSIVSAGIGGEIQPANKVFGNPNILQKLGGKESEYYSKYQGSINKPEGGVFLFAALGSGFLKGAGGVIEDVLPISFSGKPKIPLAETGKGLYSAVSNPIGTFQSVSEQASENPFGFAGEQAGAALVFTGAGRVAGKAVPSINKFIVGDREAFIRRTETFTKYDIYGREQFPNLEGNARFNLDRSAIPKITALKEVTGEPYFGQATLTGEVNIVKPNAPKGFLAEQGVNLEFIEPKTSPVFGDVEFRRVYAFEKSGPLELEGIEKLEIRTPQQKLLPDTIQAGVTKNPNVLLSPKSIEGTNPTFRIVDVINPLSERSSTQSLLFPIETPSPNVGRNVLKELYGRTDMSSVSNIPKIDNSEFFNFEPSGEVSISESVNRPIDFGRIEQTPKSNLIMPEEVSPTIDVFKESKGELKFKGINIALNRVKGVSKNESNLLPSQKSKAISRLKNINEVSINSQSLPISNEEIVNITNEQSESQAQPKSVLKNNLLQSLKTEQNITNVTSKVSEQTKSESKLMPQESFRGFVGIKLSKKDKSSRIKAQVRRRGKFSTISIESDIGKAVEDLKRKIGNTAAASGRLTTESGKVIEFNTPSGFTRSKKEKGVIIEPRERRIKSLGEKEEITFKGLRAQANRRMIKKGKFL